MSTPIPLWILRDLVCRHCKKFLSCGPVYVTPDCGLLCGRCKAIAKPNFRNYVYEELAGTFRFPCMNWENRCPYEGSWNTLKIHEIDCAYTSNSCRLICINPSAFFSSKRHLPNEESLLYLEVPEKCLNLVSCKNCGKYLSCHPVHITIVGSNICHRCYLSNGVPPQTHRNLAYEKLADIFRFPCIFRAKGCPMKFKFGRNSWEHEVACHYKDIQIISNNANPRHLHPYYGVDNDSSGYRPSYDSNSSMKGGLQTPKTIELPRVSSILRNQEELQKNQHQHQRGLNAEKEKGVVATHTGHVYATLTQNTVLFAPPQIQPNKDPTNGIKVTKEFQNRIKNHDEREQEPFSDFPALNKMRVIDLEFNNEFSPIISEYVHYNPKNNVQRNESLTIGNPEIIAELKVRNEQRRLRKQLSHQSQIEAN